MDNHQLMIHQMPMTNIQPQETQPDVDDLTFTDHNPEFVKFKERVNEWLDLDDDLKTLREATKQRNARKKELAPDILEFMKLNGIENLHTKSGGKLKYRSSMVKKPLNQKEIKSKLCEFFNNIKRGEQVANYLLENREKTERVSLSRIRQRKTKKNTNITF
jgi:ketol-acid reductoisomerase